MEEATKVDELFKKGFEIGYWLRKGNSPHLNEIIEKNANGNRYHDGLLGGKKQADREIFRERIHSNKDKSKDPEKGHDID